MLDKDLLEIKESNILLDDNERIREEVFIKEQKFKDEFDKFDLISKHVLMYYNNKAIANLRYYYDEDKEAYIIGRICVLKDYRHNNIGSILIKYVESKIKGKIIIGAQEQVLKFYLTLGYINSNDIYYDEGVKHIYVYKEIA